MYVSTPTSTKASPVTGHCQSDGLQRLDWENTFGVKFSQPVSCCKVCVVLLFLPTNPLFWGFIKHIKQVLRVSIQRFSVDEINLVLASLSAVLLIQSGGRRLPTKDAYGRITPLVLPCLNNAQHKSDAKWLQLFLARQEWNSKIAERISSKKKKNMDGCLQQVVAFPMPQQRRFSRLKKT